MTQKHARPKRAGEPVQVFLAQADQERLLDMAERLGVCKSDVLRQGLAALEAQLCNPNNNPLFQVIGIIKDDAGVDANGRDLARAHDAVLGEALESELTSGARRKRRP